MSAMLLPRPPNPHHSILIRGGPSHAVPIRIHDQRPSTWLENPEHFGQDGGGLLHILKGLRAHCNVEGGIRGAQRRRVSVAVGEPVAGIPATRESQEVVGNVNAENPTRSADAVSHLFAQEPGPQPTSMTSSPGRKRSRSRVALL